MNKAKFYKLWYKDGSKKIKQFLNKHEARDFAMENKQHIKMYVQIENIFEYKIINKRGDMIVRTTKQRKKNV